MDRYIGKLLDNRYEILEEIGNGGMAVVYKARCHRLNRMVAVKILRPNQMMDDDIRRRFHDEAQAVAMLSNSNIVSVYDVGQYEGADYIVMELIEGITLKEYMEKRGGPLNWREAVHFMTQIMQALRHAHSRGIVHRDIKPQNIMVLRDGSAKVTDFGIARIVDSQKTVTKEAFGSVHYVSPEQAEGAQVDARSDIYSAGVVLYEMLTGCLPFDGDTPLSIALQHINATAVRPRELNPDIPVGMEQICMHSMCARLEIRYPDAQTVIRDLDDFRRNPNIVFPYANPWGGKNTDTAYLPTNGRGGAAQNADLSASAQPVAAGKVDQPEGQRPVSRKTADERQQRKKKRSIFAVAVVSVIAIILIIFYMLFQNFISDLLDPGEVRDVPKVVNMTVDEAKEYIATQCGGYFEIVTSRSQYDETVEEGHIITQTPQSGSSTKSEMTTITVVVSAGVKQDDAVYMPSMLRQDYRTAESKLINDYGLEVEYGDRVFSETIDEGLIVSTDPVAGTPLEDGQKVIIYVSKGSENKSVTMPSLYGQTEEQAAKALKEVGLSLADVIMVAGAEKEGTVIFQSVKAYTDVNPGTKVYLHVSDGSLVGGSTSGGDDQPGAVVDGSVTEDEGSREPFYQITIPLVLSGEGAAAPNKASVTVMVTVNGEVILNNSYDLEAGSAVTSYKGEINSINVLVDGVQTNDFNYVDISD
ncbi:MAG: Stk1 family PASTA domain-containing Ser/Thr kinase [Oscillospiraceae bacterium]|nr:Stk1 family PASTA domain-containing Ser/Thr kinase [Oscillospiraceae bacterium]